MAIHTATSSASHLTKYSNIEMGNLLMNSMANTIKKKKLTPDLGGTNTTSEVAAEICDGLGTTYGYY